jgi:hypothetical protein
MNLRRVACSVGVHAVRANPSPPRGIRVQGEPEQAEKDTRESEGPIGATKSAKGKAPRAGGAKGARVEMDPREGNASAPQTAEVASTGLERVAELAKQNPNLRFRSLAHYITVGALFWALSRLREGAAVGVDEVSVAEYASEERVHLNLEQLHRRLRAGRYSHQPIRRVHIPKGPGKTRPIGVSCTEDKVVQMAIRDVLEVIYEQDFRDCSYGFRPRRGAHDALRAVDRMVMRGGVTWIPEADIQSVDRGLEPVHFAREARPLGLCSGSGQAGDRSRSSSPPLRSPGSGSVSVAAPRDGKGGGDDGRTAAPLGVEVSHRRWLWNSPTPSDCRARRRDLAAARAPLVPGWEGCALSEDRGQ